MIITNKINMDLAFCAAESRGDLQTLQVYVVQDDKYSRDLEITLLSGGEAWAVPEGAAVAVSYVKPDGTVGKYDTLPDGTAAWFAAGNVLTVALAPQVLTCPGLVSMHVHISTGEAVLSTFEIQLVVQRNPAINAESEDYINMSGFLQIPGQVGQIIQVSAVDADGKVTALEAVDMPGGESEANVLVVVFTTANLVTGTASHSASEISSAAEAGKLIWGRFSGDANSGTPIDYLASIDGKALFGITTTNVDFNGVVGATLIYVDDTKTLTITRGTYIMAPEPTESDIGKTLAVDAACSVAWQTPSGGVNPVQKTEDMTQSVGVDESGGLWTAPGGAGDDWRYIGKVEMAEEGAAVCLTVDSAGNAFYLKKVRIVGAVMGNTAGSSAYIRVDINNGAWRSANALFGVPAAEEYCAFDFELEDICGYIRFNSHQRSVNTASAPNELTNKGLAQYGYTYSIDKQALNSPISAVGLWSWTDCIGAGTYFDVWGIDA